MKLLIVTQKIDIQDDNLGFFHRWLEKLSRKADLVVIANSVGNYYLPDNVRVFSLGKEQGTSRGLKFLRYQRLLLKHLSAADGIFFHMCPEYVLGAWFLPKIFRKKAILWYTHKHVSPKLRLAEKIVDKIFTASSESFRLSSEKVEITGHGIDTDYFAPRQKEKSDILKIVTAGRISSVKNYEVLIEAAAILDYQEQSFEINIAGSPITEKDKLYLSALQTMVKEKSLTDKIHFVGAIPYTEIAAFYQNGDVFVNLSDTGSIDKAVLEAMSCRTNVLVANEAFRDILPKENFTIKNPQDVAQGLVTFSLVSSGAEFLREYVIKNHNLDNLTRRIVDFYLS